MKRGNLKSTKIYLKENGENVTKYAVQVRLRGRTNWIQARRGDISLIYDTQEEADQVVIDYVEELKNKVVTKKPRGK